MPNLIIGYTISFAGHLYRTNFHPVNCGERSIDFYTFELRDVRCKLCFKDQVSSQVHFVALKVEFNVNGKFVFLYFFTHS